MKFLSYFQFGFFSVSLLLFGCSVGVDSENKLTAEDVFRSVNDSMLQGDLQSALQYVCLDQRPTEEQILMIQTSLDLIPQEVKSSISYSIDEIIEKEDRTEIIATMTLQSEVEVQLATIYHQPSEAHSRFCVDMTETQESVSEEDDSLLLDDALKLENDEVILEESIILDE